MNAIPDHIQIKLQNAIDYHSKINETCLKYIDAPGEKQLKRISIYIGEQSHSLRSALNNAMWDLCETELKNRLSMNEYNKIKFSHDFPIERSNDSFENSKCRALRHIARDFPGMYSFLERVQPYHKEYEYLYKIRIFSNDNTHTIPVTVGPGNIDMMVFPAGFQAPVIRDNAVIVQWHSGGKVSKYSIPCYVDEMKMYVSSEKKWITFWMSIDNDKTLFSPTPFSKSVPPLITKLIDEFYTLWWLWCLKELTKEA